MKLQSEGSSSFEKVPRIDATFPHVEFQLRFFKEVIFYTFISRFFYTHRGIINGDNFVIFLRFHIFFIYFSLTHWLVPLEVLDLDSVLWMAWMWALIDLFK